MMLNLMDGLVRNSKPHTLWLIGSFLVACPLNAPGGIDISFNFLDESDFTSEQRELVVSGFNEAAQLWESVITGRRGNLELFEFPIEIRAADDGLAAASPTRLQALDGILMPNAGRMWINPAEIENIVVGFGISAEETNLMDELLAHEIGHALGFGSIWQSYYQMGSGEYRGEHGLAAYRQEFDPDAEFIPVELAGGGGSANSHWNQLFRSSPEEGNPQDPLALSPLVGILDARGRDFAQDLMSPALDPDFGEPFLSNTTVQSIRDMGYDVIPAFPMRGDMDENGSVEVNDIDFLDEQIRAESTDIYFDLNNDQSLNFQDHEAWIVIAGTTPGDANFDLTFNTDDLIKVFQVGEYEDADLMNSTWADGDWNGDREFDSSDLILAFKVGFQNEAALQVPEPAGILCVAMWALACLGRLRVGQHQRQVANAKSMLQDQIVFVSARVRSLE